MCDTGPCDDSVIGGSVTVADDGGDRVGRLILDDKT